MSSKAFVRVLGIVSALLACGTACSLHKSPPSSNQFAIGGGQLGCLDRAGVQMQGFFDGKASEEDVNQIWGCASHILEVFSTETRGANPDSYSSEELRQFLAKFFVKNLDLSQELTRQVGLLKQGLVGGAVDRVTFGEIHQLQSVFEVLRIQSQKLRSFMPLDFRSEKDEWIGFGRQSWKDIPEERINQLGNLLVETGTRLGTILQTEARPYRFDQLEDLINAFLKALPSDGTYAKTRSALEKVLSHLDLAIGLKRTVVIPESARSFLRLDPNGLLSSGAKLKDLLAEAGASLDQVLEKGKSHDFSAEIAPIQGQLSTLLAAIPNQEPYRYSRELLTKILLSADSVSKSGSKAIAVQDNIPVFDFLAPHAVQITDGKSWGDLLTSVTHWGSFVVRLKWYMGSERHAQGKDLESFRQIFDEAYSSLSQAVNRHDQQLLSFDEMERLVSVISEEDLPAKRVNIKVSLRPLIQRILGGTDPGSSGRAAEGVNPGVLSKLRDAFYNWYEGQHFLETLFAAIELQEGVTPSGSGRFVQDTLLYSAPAHDVWQAVWDRNEAGSSKVLAARRIESIIKALRPIFDADGGSGENEISFPPYAQGLRYTFHDLSELNWMGALSRLMLRGYAEDPARADVEHGGAGVNYAEFRKFFADFKPVGVDLKFFDPDNSRAAFNRFREGDVFTYTASGSGMQNLDQLTTLLAFAVSTMRKASRVHNDLAGLCPSKPHADKYGEALIEPRCYRQKFFSTYRQYWNGLPEMMDFYQKRSAKDQARFEYLLETSARKQGYQADVWMNSDDSQGFLAALQYVEAIFTRYDVNDSGYLDTEGAENAFPVFKDTLKNIARCQDPPTTLSDAEVREVFMYILAEGKAPEGTSKQKMWEIIKSDLKRVAHPLRVDRMRIFDIFATLSSGTPTTSTDPSCGNGIF